MGTNRRRASLLLLGWAVLGFLAFATASNEAPRTAAPANALACHHTPPTVPSEPARDPSAPPPSCQWVLPLLCCQQLATANAADASLVELGTLWVRAEVLVALPSPALVWRGTASAPAPWPPPLQRSVVLQV
jgi:hypothetical protein